MSQAQTYRSALRGSDRSRLSLSTLFCFFINCILRARSANESERRITRSSGASFDAGGIGGRFNVNDSSTCAMSRVVVCRRRGNGTFTSTFCSLWRSDFLSSKSGVEVHDEGRFGVATWPIQYICIQLQFSAESNQMSCSKHTDTGARTFIVIVERRQVRCGRPISTAVAIWATTRITRPAVCVR